MLLEFLVTKQQITRIDSNFVVENSRNYLQAKFSFSEDWVTTAKTAKFRFLNNTPYDVLVGSDLVCDVPWEVINEGKFYISVFGVFNGLTIPTNEIPIPVAKSGNPDGQLPAPPTEEIYNQILTLTTEAKENSDTAIETANNSLANVNAHIVDLEAHSGLFFSKVDKVNGKGLSTNDYTTGEKQKLAGVEAEANKYIHPLTHPASMIEEDANNRFVSDIEKTAWNNKVDKVNGKGLSTNDYTTGEKQKLAGVEAEANKYIHPLTHPASMIEEDANNRFVSDIEKTAWNNKVDKVNGKGLSTNDYTTVEKQKLAGVEAEANKYIHPLTHPASMIEEDANNRFVSDIEKSTWNDKEAGGAVSTHNSSETAHADLFAEKMDEILINNFTSSMYDTLTERGKRYKLVASDGTISSLTTYYSALFDWLVQEVGTINGLRRRVRWQDGTWGEWVSFLDNGHDTASNSHSNIFTNYYTKTEIGLFENLTTAIKTSLVNSINWIHAKFGVANGLATTDANNLVKEKFIEQVITINTTWITGTTNNGTTFTKNAHGFSNGREVEFRAGSGTLPTEILTLLRTSKCQQIDGKYIGWIVNKTDNTFQISATSGGTALNLTGGSGYEIRSATSALTISNLNYGNIDFEVFIDGATFGASNLDCKPNNITAPNFSFAGATYYNSVIAGNNNFALRAGTSVIQQKINCRFYNGYFYTHPRYCHSMPINADYTLGTVNYSQQNASKLTLTASTFTTLTINGSGSYGAFYNDTKIIIRWGA